VSVARVEKSRRSHRILVGKFEGKAPLASVDGSIILKRILQRLIRRTWTRLFWLRIGTSGGLL
jgi:hypothetical protein